MRKGVCGVKRSHNCAPSHGAGNEIMPRVDWKNPKAVPLIFSGTAFEILSIDIADVDVGTNIGAILQADQAEADLKVARAKAEERRAAAVASEQEQIAEVAKMRAKVVEAEAEVPKAISEAFRSGNLGIMDYYNIKNVQADTDMRSSIAKPDDKKDQNDDDKK